MKPDITFEDFLKLDIRLGTILNVTRVEGSSKLLKLEVDFGLIGTRIIFTGMQMWYEPDQLKGLQTIFLLNIPPKKMMGMESHGMILGLGLDHDKRPVFLHPTQPVENGEGLI